MRKGNVAGGKRHPEEKEFAWAVRWLPLLCGSSEADPEMKIHEKVIWRLCSQERWVRKYRKQDSKGGENKSHEGQTLSDPAWDSGVTSEGHASLRQGCWACMFMHRSVVGSRLPLGRQTSPGSLFQWAQGLQKARAVF